MVKLD